MTEQNDHFQDRLTQVEKARQATAEEIYHGADLGVKPGASRHEFLGGFRQFLHEHPLFSAALWGFGLTAALGGLGLILWVMSGLQDDSIGHQLTSFVAIGDVFGVLLAGVSYFIGRGFNLFDQDKDLDDIPRATMFFLGLALAAFLTSQTAGFLTANAPPVLVELPMPVEEAPKWWEVWK